MLVIMTSLYHVGLSYKKSVYHNDINGLAAVESMLCNHLSVYGSGSVAHVDLKTAWICELSFACVQITLANRWYNLDISVTGHSAALFLAHGSAGGSPSRRHAGTYVLSGWWLPKLL